MELSDDCLILVFHHLPLFERVKAEQVCRKWRTLMPYNDISTLDLMKDVPWPQYQKYIGSMSIEDPYGGVPSQEWDFLAPLILEKTLHVALKHCGAFLKELVVGQLDVFSLATPLFHTKAAQYIATLCPNLTKLDLSGSYLHDTCIAIFVSAWPKLQYFGLSHVSFMTEDNMELVHNFKGIQESFQNFPTLHPHIEELHLSWLPFMAKMTNPKLRVLNLTGVKGLNDENLINVTERCRELEVLKLDYCRGISDFAPIAKLSSLREITIPGTLLNDEGLAKICQNCQNISKLSIAFCDPERLTNLEPLSLLEKLSILDVTGVGSFNSQSLYEIGKHGRIEELCADYCGLTNDGVKNLARYCPNLSRLSVGFNDQVSDEGILFVVENCKKLKALDVSSDSKITNELLACVGSAAQGLEYLGIAGCEWISECGFQQLYQQRFYIEGVRNEGDACLQELKIRFGHVQALPPDLVRNLSEFCKVHFF